MAAEITVTASITFTKSGITESLSFASATFDFTGIKYIKHLQSIGFASEEAIDMGEITTPGWCLMVNKDSTNYVEIRPGTGVADLIRMNAGEPALFRFAADATAPFAQSNTGNVNLLYLLLEN